VIRRAPLLATSLTLLTLLVGSVVLALVGASGHERALWFLRPVVETLLGLAPAVTAHAEKGLIVAGVAAALLGMIAWLTGPAAADGRSLSASGAWSWLEGCALTAVFILALAFRFYALDLILPFFEGELSPYMSATTSLRGIGYANIGYLGPWAPLGYLYYLPIWALNQFTDLSLLNVRAAHAAVSALSVPLLYWLVRSIAGTPAALVAALFAALDPLQIGWGRSDVHPHGSTAFCTMLLCIASVRWFERGERRYLAAILALMALSFHQYPSGQFGVLVPIFLLIWHGLFNRAALRRTGWATSLILLGLPLWLAGWPLQYYLALGEWQVPDVMNIFGARTSWAADSERTLVTFATTVGTQVLVNARDLLTGLVTTAPHLHNQDLLPPVPGLPNRTLNIIAMALALLSLPLIWRSRRESSAVVLVLWAIAGAVPLLLSDLALPKRASTFYLALMGMAGLTAGTIHARLRPWMRRWLYTPFVLGLAAAGTIIGMWQWFSGRYFNYGYTPGYALTAEIQPLLTPGTILVADVWDDYMPGRLHVLLLPHLMASQPVVFVLLGYRTPSLEAILADPHEVVPMLHQSHFYWWTDLRDTLPAVRDTLSWQRIVFLSQVQSHGSEHAEVASRAGQIRQRCPAAGTRLFDPGDPVWAFQITECPISPP